MADGLSPERLQADAALAYRSIVEGGLVLVKGDIGYGLLGHSEGSMRKMYELKGRTESNPAIVIGNLDVFAELSEPLPNAVMAWVRNVVARTTVAIVTRLRPGSAYWTGLSSWVREHASRDGTVGVFLNTGPFPELIVDKAWRDGRLIVGSSANLSRTGNRYRFGDLPEAIVRGVDMSFDHGVAMHENEQRFATTIVDLTTGKIRRRGVNVDLIERELETLLETLS